MANCPVCQSEISIASQHFGTLFTCPKCSAVFFVDWGGQPEAAASNEAFTAEESPLEPMNFETPPYEQEPVPFEEIPVGEGALNYQSPPVEEEPSYDFSQPLDSVATPEPMTPFEPEKNPLNDITDFGNADLNQAAFSYTIEISGIDTGALRSQIQEAITDTKFAWNASQLMSQIKGGVLTIKSVNAVKASILIQRVKYLPVKISWRQDVLSSTV